MIRRPVTGPHRSPSGGATPFSGRFLLSRPRRYTTGPPSSVDKLPVFPWRCRFPPRLMPPDTVHPPVLPECLKYPTDVRLLRPFRNPRPGPCARLTENVPRDRRQLSTSRPGRPALRPRGPSDGTPILSPRFRGRPRRTFRPGLHPPPVRGPDDENRTETATESHVGAPSAHTRAGTRRRGRRGLCVGIRPTEGTRTECAPPPLVPTAPPSVPPSLDVPGFRSGPLSPEGTVQEQVSRGGKHTTLVTLGLCRDGVPGTPLLTDRDQAPVGVPPTGEDVVPVPVEGRGRGRVGPRLPRTPTERRRSKDKGPTGVSVFYHTPSSRVRVRA